MMSESSEVPEVILSERRVTRSTCRGPVAMSHSLDLDFQKHNATVASLFF